ncbi:hypothetical protein IHQ71_18830 [Rhizobium sp. TH2]|uniref:hypothetical protein n=1 Tax=Rhizobium sp. TH2 TaxID=2775403 RepID=UPI002157295C|nr:hypothetical protein [Rhizobium sp. TH2]UVC07261.1 hypothetical protein IHQ71_18830 [Rhizobium sp. TH2]
MTRITGDDFMLVGLHKMAAERGDGFVPEMLEILKRSREGFDERTNVMHFPTSDLDVSPMETRPASNENNVIAFPRVRQSALNG